MEFFNVGLLVAVATPVAVVVVMNALLALGGEKGTLLLPSLRGFPPVLEPQTLAVAQELQATPAVVRAVRAPVALDIGNLAVEFIAPDAKP